MPGEPKDFLIARAQEVGITYTPDSFPVIFWDLFARRAIRCAPPSPRWGPCFWRG